MKSITKTVVLNCTVNTKGYLFIIFLILILGIDGYLLYDNRDASKDLFVNIASFVRIFNADIQCDYQHEYI